MDSKLTSIFARFPNKQRDDLIPMLHEIQDKYGFLSEDLIVEAGKYLNISVNKIYGVATFYDNFRFGPRGKFHIRLCHGTACHVAGSSNILSEIEKQLKISNGETDKYGLFSLEIVSCIGACGLAPLIEINDEYHANLTLDSLKNILNHYRENHNTIYEDQ
ncbi:MAG: NAD(P)H-dependent oxidoreductase subunit E [Bacteroidetes bacterium]|nr:MAG: NAD(P)H-dependent oxidoreductase subunit E [Bacteroidota bacterium]